MSREPRIKAIPQELYGCRFRSTLEARWAVFFTTARMDWEYEPEGYELPSGWYRPDFRVSASGLSIWVEVKPVVDTEDDPRWADLAAGSGLMVFVVRGMHRRGDRCDTAHRARVWHPGGTVAEVHRLWQAPEYADAWDAASGAQFGKTGGPGTGSRRGRRKR